MDSEYVQQAIDAYVSQFFKETKINKEFVNWWVDLDTDSKLKHFINIEKYFSRWLRTNKFMDLYDIRFNSVQLANALRKSFVERIDKLLTEK